MFSLFAFHIMQEPEGPAKPQLGLGTSELPGKQHTPPLPFLCWFQAHCSRYPMQ